MNAKLFVTSISGDQVLSEKRDAVFEPDTYGQELNIVNLYPQMQYQQISGFGGAITAAVCSTLENMPKEKAQEIINAYFGPDGIGYRAIRTHIDSCDFSQAPYCAITDASDEELTTFSLDYDEKHMIPWIKAACQAAGEDLPVMLSPWSPPAFMKTNGSRTGGGHLKKEYYPVWARYLCRYIQAYRRLGIQVTSMTVQNEPNAAQAWDSCLFTSDEEREFLSNYLYPSLQSAGLGDIEIYIWDHNKERLFDRAAEVIDPVTNSMIAGLAFHWYTGDHFDALRIVREAFPDKKLVFSEGCIEYSRFDKNQLANAEMYAHDMIGNLAAGMNLFLDWNICLDENGGPNYVGNYCEAPIICNTREGRLEYKLSFHYISHFSKHIRPSAHRIATTNFSSLLETVAFKNPDDTLAVVLLNRTEKKIPVVLRLNGNLCRMELAGGSIATAIIESL